jgi:multidrug efflux system outer membrane protein
MDTRPDLAAASNRYRSANNRVASAALGFAPSFRITGNIGYQLRWFNEWDTQETWGLGAGVSIPIFGGLQRIGTLKQAIASRDAAARSLSATAIQAQGEVESALIREDTETARLTALSKQLQAAQLAYEESLRQYAAGLTNHITVLSSLSSWQAAELNHLQAQRDVLGARIDLHTALGAPWAVRLNSVGGAR